MTASRHLNAVPGTPDVALADADGFKRVLAQNWDAGLLVARSAAPGTTAHRVMARNSHDEKLSFREFGERAGCHHSTVSRYLDAWDRAASDGLVPYAAELSPGQAVDLEAAKTAAMTWDDYYSPRPQREEPDEVPESLAALPEMGQRLVKVIGARPGPSGRAVDVAYKRALNEDPDWAWSRALAAVDDALAGPLPPAGAVTGDAAMSARLREVPELMRETADRIERQLNRQPEGEQ